jgi:hypothetical protein
MKMVMTRQEFWNQVDEFGWGTKTTDYKAIKIYFMQKGTQYTQAFENHFDFLRNNLDNKMWQYHTQIGCGDDSWSDLICHVIGLGQKEYEACLVDPQLFVGRGNRNDYTESFCYGIPGDWEFEDLAPEVLAKRAKKHAASYKNMTYHFHGLKGSLEEMISLLEDVKVSDLDKAKVLSKYIAEKAKKKADGMGLTYTDGGNAVYNYWCVWNLYTDVEMMSKVND